MNLRQKKKRLKRQVESMRAEMDAMRRIEQPLVKVKRPEVKTVANISYYHMHDYNGRRLADMHREVGSIITHIINEEYIEFSEELIDIGACPMMKITAKLRVVVPDGGDGV